MNKKHTSIYIFYLLLFTFFVSSCQFKPQNVLSEKKMEKVMYDIYVAEAIIGNDYGTFDSSEKKEALINQIYEKHGITKIQWDSSLAYYSDHIGRYLEMNDSVKARLQRKKKRFEDLRHAQFLAENNQDDIDGPDLWNIIKRDSANSSIHTVISLYTPDFQHGFTLQRDSSWITKMITDTLFSFEFNVTGICKLQKEFPVATLMLDYKDTTLYQSQKIDENRHYKFSISTYIPDDTLQSLSGFVHTAKATQNIQFYNISLGNKNDQLLPKQPSKTEEKATAQNFKREKQTL